jgi:pyrroloquinoline quinone biosynthesis protein E
MGGRTFCEIAPNGEVMPCSAMGLSGGNIRDQSLADIWENSPLFNSMRREDSLPDVCRSCKYLPSCFGGCKALTNFKNGKFTRDIYCKIESEEEQWR